MTADLDVLDTLPVMVQRSAFLPFSADAWQTVRYARATKMRIAPGNDLGSAEVTMAWGQIADPNDDRDGGMDAPTPPIDVDDLVRLIQADVIDGVPTPTGAEFGIGLVESINWDDPKRASIKVTGLGALLAKVYTSRGVELTGTDGYGDSLVETGYLPTYNALPDGDCSVVVGPDGVHVHDRRGSGVPWTAYKIAGNLLRYAMRANLPGAPSGIFQMDWRMDASSPAYLDYVPDPQDFDGLSVAECLNRLFGSRRGMTWRITTDSGYAQIRIVDLESAGSSLDTSGDLSWGNPQIQDRRDGYDYVLVTAARPLVGITLWWTPGSGTGTGSLEPDGWTPGASADAALATLLEAEKTGAPYTGPIYRRFRLRPDWDGSQYDGSAVGSSTIGLRNAITDPGAPNTPPDGDRWFSAPCPPPGALTIERELPAGAGFTADPNGPRQAPVVIAGAAGRWEDLSEPCKPTPLGGSVPGERGDRSSAVLLLGDSAEDADQLRQALGTGGSLLVTIGVREWAPLQCAWCAAADDWSEISPRVYRLRRSGLEQHLCLAGCITATDGSTLTTAAEISTRDDVPKLRTIRDQLAVRYGRAITALSITYNSILTDWLPGDILADITLVDGRNYLVGQPCAEVSWDFVRRQTILRWAPLIQERPIA